MSGVDPGRRFANSWRSFSLSSSNSLSIRVSLIFWAGMTAAMPAFWLTWPLPDVSNELYVCLYIEVALY